MADEEQKIEETHEPEAEAPARKSWLPKLLTLAIILSVVAAECLAVYLYLPGNTASAEEDASSAETVDRLAEPPPAVENAPKDEAKHVEVKEVDLGEFRVAAYQPATGTTLRIDFHLHGIVPATDEARLLELLALNQNRLRDQVIVTARSANISDLSEAGLGLIKRRILEKTHHALGAPILTDVVFSDFSVTER